MRRVLSIAKKEILQIRRDRRMLPLIFIAPLLQVVLFGYVATTDVKEISLGVYDPHPSQATRELVAKITAPGYFRLYGVTARLDSLDSWLDAGKISVGLALDADYARNLATGRTAKVAVLVDGTDSNSASIAQGYLAASLQAYSVRLLQQKAAGLGRVSLPMPIDLRSEERRVGK